MKAVSGKAIARVLEKKGWKLKRIRGSHHFFERPGHESITVPIHGNHTLRKGTQHTIMKAAKLTDADL